MMGVGAVRWGTAAKVGGQMAEAKDVAGAHIHAFDLGLTNTVAGTWLPFTRSK